MEYRWNKVLGTKYVFARFFRAILCVTLVMGLMPYVAFAQEKPEFSSDEVSLAATADGDSTIIDERWFRIENPLYNGSGKAEETSPQSANALALLSAEEETAYVSYDEAVGIITEAMANRQETISVSLKTDENYASLSRSMFYDAMEEDGNPEHGDYLRWIWGTVSFGMTGTKNESTGIYKITYTYTIEYYTTATQEQQLMAKVDEVLGDMNLNGKSDYEKTKAIYDFICENVAYDYDNLEDGAYKLKHTAYAALMNGTSVCQGYASLFYLMAGKAGLSTRVIAGVGNGENHGWNIVGLDGGYYYNVDATWDSSKDPYEYFLKSDGDFPGHTRGLKGAAVDYASDEFYAAYPMAETSYDPSLIVLDIPAAVRNLIYSGSKRTGVPEGEGYELSGTTAATDVGSYTAMATPLDGYVWADRTSEPVIIEWSIAPADISAAEDVVITQEPWTEDGQDPVYSICFNKVELSEPEDYRATRTIQVDRCIVELEGCGNFTGNVAIEFEFAGLMRLSGTNRYGTMGAIVSEGFAEGSCEWAIVATGENFPDALAASSLAGALSAPIVLTPSDFLSSETVSAVERVGASNILVIGGAGAVSDHVIAQLRSIECVSSVERVSGSNRYETSMKIYEKGVELGVEWSDTAIIATGENFADALSIAPYAYSTDSPIFLADPSSGLFGEALEAIQDGEFADAVIVGGEGAVSVLAEDGLEGIGLRPVRLSGSDRYETSLEIARWAVAEGVLGVSHVAFTTGANFPDALAGGPLCGAKGSIILLAKDASTAVTAAEWVASVESDLGRTYALGGTGILSESVADTISKTLYE